MEKSLIWMTLFPGIWAQRAPFRRELQYSADWCEVRDALLHDSPDREGETRAASNTVQKPRISPILGCAFFINVFGEVAVRPTSGGRLAAARKYFFWAHFQAQCWQHWYTVCTIITRTAWAQPECSSCTWLRPWPPCRLHSVCQILFQWLRENTSFTAEQKSV